MRDAPVCIDCHGEHLIMDPSNPASPLNAANISAQTCGRCHGDPRLALRYDLPADRLPSYADSYHGLALEGGKLTAANCASCHGVHDILRSSDPRSTVNAANLSKTCGQCHKGVGESKFTIGPVHVQTECRPQSSGGAVDSLDVLGADPGHAGFHAAAQSAGPAGEDDPAPPAAGNQRSGAAHESVVPHRALGHHGEFPDAGVTGFALKYPESWWAKPLLIWESGSGVRGGLHRTAAIV